MASCPRRDYAQRSILWEISGDPVPQKPLVAIIDDDESIRHATQNLLDPGTRVRRTG
jgi:hypothetical protein